MHPSMIPSPDASLPGIGTDERESSPRVRCISTKIICRPLDRMSHRNLMSRLSPLHVSTPARPGPLLCRPSGQALLYPKAGTFCLCCLDGEKKDTWNAMVAGCTSEQETGLFSLNKERCKGDTERKKKRVLYSKGKGSHLTTLVFHSQPALLVLAPPARKAAGKGSLIAGSDFPPLSDLDGNHELIEH